MYSKINPDGNKDWQIKFFESLGGKSHVKYNCCQFPLIPSNRSKNEKANCNLRRYIQNNGCEIVKSTNCNRKESFNLLMNMLLLA